MADWAAIRRRAYEQHLRLRVLCKSHGHPLIPADALLKAAEIATGLGIQSLPSGDPLLSGAQAFLDRDSEMIWYASGGDFSAERQRFAQAHEFAHFWLHPDLEMDPSLPEDSPQTYMAALLGSSAQVEEGYSPQERREREANLFAAELLLPAPFLRQAYHELGLRAEQIAAHTGLSETCVLTQLAYALLVPAAAPPANAQAATPPAVENSPAPIGLDPSQEQAAAIATGPTLVDAGPGTGKTRTLTARIRHLVRDRALPPENILALTFSNRAAEEMVDRLRGSLGETAHRIWIGTFHAFGFELLRKDGQRIGLPVRPVLLEPGDAITLLERHFDLLGLSEYEYLHNPALPFPDILNCISRAKDELKSPEEYRRAAESMAEIAQSDEEQTEAARAAEIAHVYEVYESLLRTNGLVDYGDLIARAVELLERCPDVLQRWRAQYPQILADEYQDVNRATARLLQLLADNGKGFWAVGDLRQAIYRFRGASPANIREFDADFPGGQRLSLQYNYRSRPGLIRLFGAFAADMGTPAEGAPVWTACRREGTAPAITLKVSADEDAQAEWLAEQIHQRERRGIARKEQAILVSTNRQASELAELLEARGVPVQHMGSLFDRAEVKDLLALLSLASEPEGLGLKRVAQFPEIGIPDEDVGKILAAVHEADRRFPFALEWAVNHVAVSEAGAQGLKRLRATLLPVAYRGDAWMLLSRYLFETSGYLGSLLREETVRNQQKRLAIYQLLLTVQQMTQRLILEPGENSRAAFLHRLRRILQLRQSRSVRIPDAGDAIDGVRIMTIHQSKGLEFPVVYLPNLVKGQFPPRGRGRMATLPEVLIEGADNEDAQVDDLFFVALSRARDELVLSRPASWNGKPVDPSPLLQRVAGALSAEGASWNAVQADAGNSSLSLPTVMNAAAEHSNGAERPLTVDEPPMPEGEKPELSLSALRQYQTCPRQYYYRRVLGLPEPANDSAYRTFDRHLQDTLAWLQGERAKGLSPSSGEVQAAFQARWPVGSPEEETALTRVLRQRAASLLDRAHVRFGTTARPGSQREFKAELEHGTIRLRSDEVETSEDGRLRITQHLHRRPKKDDHTAGPLALLRHAAKQEQPDRPVDVALFSTATGDTREVKEDRRWEPKRVEKYDIALRELGEGRFPPNPGENECAACPFFFICPA